MFWLWFELVIGQVGQNKIGPPVHIEWKSMQGPHKKAPQTIVCAY